MDQLAQQLRKVIVAGDRYRRVLARAAGLGAQEAAALGELQQSGALAPKELGRRLGLASASITRVLDRLESAGLAQRLRHPADRRGVLVVLTDAGRVVSKVMSEVFVGDIEEAMLSARADHLQEYTGVLRDVASALGDRAGDPDRVAAELHRRGARQGQRGGADQS